MNVTCLREHVPQFTELGFTSQNDEGQLAEMVDEEANYGHSGEMPDNIPYYGYHCAGGDYGAMDFACDGKTFTEWESGHSGGYVFHPPDFHPPDSDDEKWAEQLREFDKFRRIMNATRELLTAQEPSKTDSKTK